MGSRRKARELALKKLYSMEQGGRGPDETAAEAEALGNSGSPASRFAGELLKSAAGNLEYIDDKIRTCSLNWDFSRIMPTDKSILRLAVSELLSRETPPAVVIDEAVELAKKYGTEKSPGFINGVLDCARKKIEEEAGREPEER